MLRKGLNRIWSPRKGKRGINMKELQIERLKLKILVKLTFGRGWERAGYRSIAL